MQIAGPENLKVFLEGKHLHLKKEVDESTIKELSESGSASIPNVQLRPQDLKRLGML